MIPTVLPKYPTDRHEQLLHLVTQAQEHSAALLDILDTARREGFTTPKGHPALGRSSGNLRRASRVLKEVLRDLKAAERNISFVQPELPKQALCNHCKKPLVPGTPIAKCQSCLGWHHRTEQCAICIYAQAPTYADSTRPTYLTVSMTWTQHAHLKDVAQQNDVPLHQLIRDVILYGRSNDDLAGIPTDAAKKRSQSVPLSFSEHDNIKAAAAEASLSVSQYMHLTLFGQHCPHCNQAAPTLDHLNTCRQRHNNDIPETSVSFRVSQEQKVSIQTAAKARGTSVNRYIHNILFHNTSNLLTRMNPGAGPPTTLAGVRVSVRQRDDLRARAKTSNMTITQYIISQVFGENAYAASQAAAQDNRRTRHLTIYVTAEQSQAIRTAARLKKQSVSNHIRNVIVFDASNIHTITADQGYGPKTKLIGTAVTLQENRDLRARAKHAGLSISQYARLRLFGQT